MDGPMELYDDRNFAGDGLFCEWVYVIDLDEMNLEVYTGFKNSEPLAGQRFHGFGGYNDHEYGAVQLVKAWKISDLPTKDEFLVALEGEE